MNHKKYFGFILLMLIGLLTLSTIVNAVEYTDISNDWHTYEDSFLVEGTLYELKLNELNNDYLRLTVDNTNYLLKVDSCKTVNEFKYCYDSYDFDNDKSTIAPDGTLVPGIKVIIKKEKDLDASTISTTSDIPSTIQNLEDTVILVTVKNTGQDWINKLDLELTIPQNMKLINQKDFIRIGNKLKVTTSLARDQEKKYSFEVRPENYEDYKINYSEKYESVGKTKTLTGAFDFNVAAPFTLTTSLSKNSANVGDELTYIVTLKDTNEKYDLNINKLDVEASKQFLYKIHKKLNIVGFGKFASAERYVRSGSDTEFKITFQPINTGKSNITMNYEFEINDHIYSGVIEKQIDIKENDLSGALYLNKKEILPGEKITAYLDLTNNRDLQAYKNISIHFTSDLFNKDLSVEELLSSDSKSVEIGTFKAPSVESDKEYSVKAVISYKLISNQVTFSKEFKNSFKVIGSGKVIKITQKIDKIKDIKPGDNISVTVIIENLNNQFFDELNVYDLFPRQLEIIAGKSKATNSLSSKESRQEYIYKLKIPKDFTSKKFNITTKAVIPEIGYETSTQTTLTVTLPKPKKKTLVDDKKKESPGQNDVVVKSKKSEKSWFGKLIDSIDDFFSSLLGKGK